MQQAQGALRCTEGFLHWPLALIHCIELLPEPDIMRRQHVQRRVQGCVHNCPHLLVLIMLLRQAPAVRSVPSSASRQAVGGALQSPTRPLKERCCGTHASGQSSTPSVPGYVQYRPCLLLACPDRPINHAECIIHS